MAAPETETPNITASANPINLQNIAVSCLQKLYPDKNTETQLESKIERKIRDKYGDCVDYGINFGDVLHAAGINDRVNQSALNSILSLLCAAHARMEVSANERSTPVPSFLQALIIILITLKDQQDYKLQIPTELSSDFLKHVISDKNLSNLISSLSFSGLIDDMQVHMKVGEDNDYSFDIGFINGILEAKEYKGSKLMLYTLNLIETIGVQKAEQKLRQYMKRLCDCMVKLESKYGLNTSSFSILMNIFEEEPEINIFKLLKIIFALEDQHLEHTQWSTLFPDDEDSEMPELIYESVKIGTDFRKVLEDYSVPKKKITDSFLSKFSAQYAQRCIKDVNLNEEDLWKNMQKLIKQKSDDESDDEGQKHFQRIAHDSLAIYEKDGVHSVLFPYFFEKIAMVFVLHFNDSGYEVESAEISNLSKIIDLVDSAPTTMNEMNETSDITMHDVYDKTKDDSELQTNDIYDGKKEAKDYSELHTIAPLFSKARLFPDINSNLKVDFNAGFFESFEENNADLKEEMVRNFTEIPAELRAVVKNGIENLPPDQQTMWEFLKENSDDEDDDMHMTDNGKVKENVAMPSGFMKFLSENTLSTTEPESLTVANVRITNMSFGMRTAIEHYIDPNATNEVKDQFESTFIDNGRIKFLKFNPEEILKIFDVLRSLKAPGTCDPTVIFPKCKTTEGLTDHYGVESDVEIKYDSLSRTLNIGDEQVVLAQETNKKRYIISKLIQGNIPVFFEYVTTKSGSYIVLGPSITWRFSRNTCGFDYKSGETKGRTNMEVYELN